MVSKTLHNLGMSIGTALAGAVLISALTASFFTGIATNPDVPNDLSSKAQTELRAACRSSPTPISKPPSRTRA